ncbi:ester hydrolase C11orf54 homolog isoform X2 [Rhinatrema bivittatum]|uniref:ester hydrolase C11orf54 homolog isoform X2 n=1 Tax=Rhinatrema bivittatum TaxID=194408 RepID=UPI00112EDE12|nr:ester hydrolase C11orf54 homolog isoform X2 [Rhinatrema bivittatum]
MGETESFACHVPDLPELAEVLQIGLKKNYADVQVSVVECPDLTQEPFRFPVKGICGKARIADVGGVPYLVPLARLDKIYNINAVAKEIELPGAFILGAGAVSHRTLGENAELILSVQAAYGDKAAVNGSYVARISPAGGGCVLEKYSDRYTDCDFGLLSNLYASRGEPGKVIQVSASRRTGKENFVSCMRKTLESHYGDKPVGMGGTFIIQEGKAKLHIMGFDLRLEHTHCFSHHGEGGHYHTDTTPETVRYLGYFHPAELLYRIDRPKETHTVGRD